MIVAKNDHYFQRLIEILQPVGDVMFIVEGYFDESGTLDEPPGIFCVSGYFIEVDAAKQMDAEWDKILAEHSIPYFHMVDCAHGAGIFAGMPVEERSDVVKKLIDLIKTFTIEGYSIFASSDVFESSLGSPDIYSECVSGCVMALHQFLRMSRVEGDVAYFFEDGHKNKGNAYNHIAKNVKRPGDSVTFAAKEKIRLIQAADLLAWQSTKYAKDYLYPMRDGKTPKRNPRKDFQSLMEHNHSFMHMGMRDGKKYMAIELWPLSKRSRWSVDVSVNDDGPILFWRESGDDTPIVPVEKTLGWRMGGGRMAYVAFENMNQKPFALSFDEPRLIEAAMGLLEATGMYEDSKIVPLFSVEDTLLQEENNVTVLRLKLRGGSSLAFHMPNDVINQLKEKLIKK
jgi:hypothetical protein